MLYNLTFLTSVISHLSLNTEKDDGTYTLVQFVSSPACLKDAHKVCHSDLGTAAFTLLTTADDQTACTKLVEKEGKFQVDACMGTGGSCPADTCGDCVGFFHGDLTLDVCQDGYMLVKVKPDFCTGESQDVGLARWCDRVPTPVEAVKDEKSEGPAEAVSFINLANAYQKMAQDPVAVPEQGYEGQPVAHENKKTTLSNWRQEYGPNGPQDPNYPMHEEKKNNKGWPNSANMISLSLLILCLF